MTQRTQPPRIPLLDRRFRRHSRGHRLDHAATTHKLAAARSLKPDQLDSYIAIDTDGTITAYYGKIDGGQGLGTSIAQMVAEEIRRSASNACTSSWATPAAPSTWAARAPRSAFLTAA